MPAFWTFAILALCMGGCTWLTYEAANRPGDDFGAGLLVWVCAALTLIFSVVALFLLVRYA